MAHSRIIPKVKDCIAYIESCGWEFSHFDRHIRWYVFRGKNGRRTMSGSTTIPFTLRELREAYENGW